MIEWKPVLIDVVTVISLVAIFSMLVQGLIYLVQLFFAGVSLRNRPPLAATTQIWQRYVDVAPPISVIAPAYNEEATIVESVNALLALHYPDFEVIVVNDGSRDRTLEVLIDVYGLQPIERYHDLPVHHAPIRGLYGSPRFPRLLVVDKVNGGGKADAMNAGISVTRSPLFCVIDADTLLEPDALIRIVRPFIEEPIETVAVGGTIRIANGCRVDHGRVVDVRLPRNFLALVQIVEYLRAFLMGRLGLSRMGCVLIVSGAFGLFRRKTAVEVGGFSENTVGEDMEMVVKMHRLMRDRGQPYRVTYIAEPVSWTEAPETLRDLGSQRSRWQRGSLEVFFKHRDMFLNPRYGRIGMYALPTVFIIDVVGPLFEVTGLIVIPLFWALGMLNTSFLLALTAVTFVFGVFLSIATLIVEEVELRRFPKIQHLMIISLVSIVENFGYRQLCSFWRLRGWWEFMRKKKAWGEMTRKGFQSS